jgi:hypothetical protein
VTAGVAACALAVWVGGIVALGSCAAPVVFGMVPAPLSGDAMGTVFRKFDAIAIACGIVILGCEALRVWLRGTRTGSRASVADLARGIGAVAMTAAAIYGGLLLSPAILELHAAGAVRGSGTEGLELERLHAWAEAIAKTQVVLGFLVLMLQVVTLGVSSPEERT